MDSEDEKLEYILKYKDTPNTSLYEWSIDEIDREGKVVSEDLIPWDWRLHFKITSISYVSSMSAEYNYFVDDDNKNTYKEYFRAELEQFDHNEPRLEIFGDKKAVKEISLIIYSANEKDDDSESLRAYASNDFEFEIDFEVRFEPSYLRFQLFLNDNKFDELKELVKQNRASHIHLNVTECAGFYSHWTPLISTSLIKILTTRHKIQALDGREDLPRLGNIERYEFTYVTSQDLVTIPEENENEIEPEEIQESQEDEHVISSEEYTQIKIRSELQSINEILNDARHFAMAIIILLLLILIFS